ncbi:MAG: hypothetical protein B7W98_03335, partial [Parcubacteria group bacterium 20-58-5]
SEIEILRGRGYTISAIARGLKRSKSGIWYELQKKRRGRKYDARYAKQLSYVRPRYHRAQGKKIALHQELRTFVEDHLLDDQSPEGISGRLKNVARHLPYVSKSAIRRYITSPYGRRIEYHRKRVMKKKYRRRGAKKKIEGKRMISKRPLKINNRWGLGHMEGDFIVSGRTGKGLLFGLVDRKVRKNMLERILPVSIRNVERALVRMQRRYPELQTITFDNDLLFLEHKRLERKLGVRIYFCEPRSPWQKPSIEHLNKVLRRYIPKSSDLSKYSKRFIHTLEQKLNRRFMECLGFLSPDEAYERERKRKQRRAALRHRKS